MIQKDAVDAALASLNAALHKQLLETGLVTVAQWNEGIAPSLKGVASVCEGSPVHARSYRVHESIYPGTPSATLPKQKPCETCNDDPAVCATVPGLRHCEKATRGDELKRAAELLRRYASIARESPAAELERFDYIPEIEDAAAAVEHAATMSATRLPMAWIPVSERLPTENDRYYLALREGDVESETCAHLWHNGAWCYGDGSESDIPVTHWMPIPKLEYVDGSGRKT